ESVAFSPLKKFNTFVINATSGPNGAIDPSGDVVVNYGDNKTFLFTPAEGYKVYAFWVDGDSISDAGSYTFSNVTANYSIYVEFALIIGVDEKSTQSVSVKTWPSPATTHINIEVGNNAFGQNELYYVITGLDGNAVGEGKLEKMTERIQLDVLQSGVFLLHVFKNGSLVQTVKLIKL
ncbi:MAG TPA: hypothetical protein PK939_07025, partial [Bacteroidales bacterium]|nr:hypothetical protein [Bacteroidales bacterium]